MGDVGVAVRGRRRGDGRAGRGRALAGVVALLVGAGLVVTSPAAAPAAAATVPDSFTFTGSGWGHGLGMSQYGAYGQALEGWSAERILEHYYAPAQVATATSDPILRVQVLASESSVTVTRVSGSWRLNTGSDLIPFSASTVTFEHRSDGRVATTVNGRTYTTSTNASSRLSLEWTGTNTWPGTAGTVRVPKANSGTGSVTYRHGFLSFSPATSGSRRVVNVINSVRLEDYVKGLAEMPSSWPAAALQAQAIAGRTFALRMYEDGLKSNQAHLTDEVTHQKYTAWNKENETTYGKYWAGGAAEAAGRVLRHDRALVSTYYSSSSGGRTQNSEDVWGGATLGYLRSRDDHWALDPRVRNPYASWTATISQSRARSLFGLPDVAKLEVTRRAASGAVMQVRATSSSGRTADLLARPTTDGVRTALGLRSPYFSIGFRSAVERLAGEDRYATAVAVGRAAFPTGDEVVVVSGDQASLVDGLVAAPFAHARRAPVLLAAKDSLPAATRAEIERRSPDRVWLVGGSGVLTARLVREIESLGADVTRLAGEDRYGTAVAVAERMGTAGTVVIASGSPANLVDAAAAGGAAASVGAPVLLTPRAALPGAVRRTITGLGASRSVVVGGGGIVSGEVVGQLRAGGWNPVRVAGDDRYETAAAVASHFAGSVGTDTVLIASGLDANLVDSLTGGVLGHLTLLTSTSVPAVTDQWLERRQVSVLRVAGGTGVVPTHVVEALR